jgi:hypothetical protein
MNKIDRMGKIDCPSAENIGQLLDMIHEVVRVKKGDDALTTKVKHIAVFISVEGPAGGTLSFAIIQGTPQIAIAHGAAYERFSDFVDMLSKAIEERAEIEIEINMLNQKLKGL